MLKTRQFLTPVHGRFFLGETMLNIHKQQANNLRRQAVEGCQEHINPIEAKESLSPEDNAHVDHLKAIQTDLKIQHCMFLAWYTANEEKSEWLQMSSQRLWEIIHLYDLVAMGDLGIDYDEFFPSKTGFKLSEFQEYFRSKIFQEYGEHTWGKNMIDHVPEIAWELTGKKQ